ncbi:lysophospholipid acyltransferase family protein [bacterium]|nr:lysophospholipid acyltransferase family protein [bacterium]
MKKLILLFGHFVCLLPRKVQLSIGASMGLLFWVLSKRRRNITIDNIKIAFPNEKTPQRLALKCYKHFGNVFLEILFNPTMDQYFSKYLSWNNEEIIFEKLKKKQGVVLLTAHFGNWETLGTLSQFDCEIWPIYQEQSNKFVDDLLIDLRSSIGVNLIKKSDRETMVQCLNNAQVLGNVGDEGRAIPIPFFGIETHFPAGPVKLALETNSAIIFAVGIRKGDHIVHEVLEEIPIIKGQNDQETYFNTMTIYAKKLEELVAKHPEQYFWLHDIWRRHKK